jgi:hypothetical protein
MARRMIAVLAGVALGGACLSGLASPTPQAAAIGPSPTIRQFAGAAPTPYRVPDSVVKVGAGLYVTDEHAIDRVDIETDDFAIWAGDRSTSGSADGALATARFDNPSGIATDERNLYLADTGNHTVRKINLATGQVSTLAGTPGASGSTDAVGTAARFNNPAAVAVSDDGTRLFVADEGNGTVRTVDLATRQVTTLAGTAGQFGTADGIGSAARFTAPRALDSDGGALWVGDGARIRKVVLGTAQVSTLTEMGTPEFNTVTGITSTDTHLYVADLYNDHDGSAFGDLYKVDKVTGGLAVKDTGSFETTGVVLDGTGQTLFAAGALNQVDADVYQYDIVTGTSQAVASFGEKYLSVDGVGPAARLKVPERMGTDGTNLYVLAGSGGIRKVAPTGAVTTLPGQVFGGDVATDGVNLYTVDSRDVKKVVLATGQVTTLVTIGTAPDFAQGIALDGVNLYISHSNCALYRYQLTTGTLSVHAGVPGACAHVDGSATTARFLGGSPMGIYGDDLFVTEWPSTIRRVKVSTGAVSTVASSGLSYPGDVSSDGTFVYTTSRPPLVYAPTDVVKVSVATGAVTVLTGQYPLTYAARPASTTAAGDSLRQGGYVTSVTALHGGHDIYFLNQTGVGLLTDAKVPPQLSIGDVTVTEGDGGTGLAVFTVRLSSPQPNPVGVVFLTNDGTATAASGDYVGQSGRLDFPPGVVEQRVKITVNGDATDEAGESFKVRLVWPSGGATLGRAIGTATILDDDPNGGGATLAVGDVSIVEGDDLGALAIFPVRLSSAQPGPVTVNFGTGDGTATAASGDYDGRLGTLTIPTGVTNATIFVKVNGDYDPEALEAFTLTIAGSSGPTITRATGTGGIINDD